jgi:YegS/Rv2252/BmrU family lipid kinase
VKTESAQKLTCILNGGAGSCDPDAIKRLLRSIAREYGADLEVVATEPGGDLTARAELAIKSGSSIIVAAGGDGTINAVASAVVKCEAVLGVLPLGTLNHFAKDLGIPLEIEAAIRNLFTGVATAVDVGEVNGKIFLNNSSLGLYPRIVRQREARQSRGERKWVAFARALVYVLKNHSTIYLRIKIDDATAELRKTPFVFIGNNRYEITGLAIGKRSSLSDQRIWICKAPATDRLGLLRLTLRALSGRLKDSDLEAVDAKEIWIETRSPQIDVAADGEVIRIEGPLRYRSRPQALKVIVPR